MPYLARETASACPVLSLYRKGRRWLRLSFDNAAGDGKGCYFIDGSSVSASLGWGGSEADAKAQFIRELRQETTELNYISGWQVPALIADGAAMTTAQFARRFAAHPTWWCRYRDGEPQPRVVCQVRSADLIFEGPRYIHLPKASQLRALGEAIVVLDCDGTPMLTYTPCSAEDHDSAPMIGRAA